MHLSKRQSFCKNDVFVILVLCFFAVILTAVADTSTTAANSNLLSIAEFQNSLATNRQTVRSFRLEGVVCAFAPKRNIVVLQDGSASVMLEIPSITGPMHVGDRVAVEGEQCMLTRTRFYTRIDTTPAVDNDGTHSKQEKTGTVFLEKGMNAIRVEWFNGPSDAVLDLEYEGPDSPLQKVPASALWHDPSGGTNHNETDLKPGLHYAAYEEISFRNLPIFSQFKPTAEGVATNFSMSYRTRDENCGLSFHGFIQISRPGLYTFHLVSDDGARLYVGKRPVSLEVLMPSPQSKPAPENFEQALSDRGRQHWVEMEGEVVFVSENKRCLEIEMIIGDHHVPITVVDGPALLSTNLLHNWIGVNGICEFSRDSEDKKLIGIFVPGPDQVKIFNSAENIRNVSTNLLTTAAQVRRLKPEEAKKNIPVKIRGVVIYAAPASLVLQDSTGGVFLGTRSGVWAIQPSLGELWEVEGTTGPGDFSPVIVVDKAKYLGEVALPEPVRPTRDQLMNGNLDAEYGELRGILTVASNTEITLLMPDGKVTVLGDNFRPLPRLPKPAPGGSLVGSVVRLRGCFAPRVDLQTRQVVPGNIFLYPALVEVEDPVPLDPFLLPTRRASDLMWFDAHASALQRTKLAGQVIHASPGEYFILDGRTGFRVLAKNAPELRTGDHIEAVGFPKLDGSSPVLQEAQIRKTFHTELPVPIKVSMEKLLDRNCDSTLIQVEAMLISDTIHQDEEVLELQNGSRYFVARLKSTPQTRTLLPAGCRLRLTGVYASADGDHMGTTLAPFELLLNNAADIVVLERPSWWTVRHAITIVLALAGALGLMLGWVAQLRRKVEERTAQLKKEIEERQLAEQHHAVEQERIRVARDLHDELGAGLTEVSMLGALANTAAIPQETKERYLNQLTQMARSLVASLDEIVWAVNPHYDSTASLASYFSLFAQPFLNLAGIACRLEVAKDLPDYPLDSRMRHGLFCAFKEALNNVIRHSGATEVHLVFEVTEDHLRLSIVDNGRGIERADRAPGKDGMTGLCQRMKQLGGDCLISSQSTRGTKVEFHLPLKRI